MGTDGSSFYMYKALMINIIKGASCLESRPLETRSKSGPGFDTKDMYMYMHLQKEQMAYSGKTNNHDTHATSAGCRKGHREPTFSSNLYSNIPT